MKIQNIGKERVSESLTTVLFQHYFLFSPGVLCTVIGWGGTDINQNLLSEVLQKVTVPLISNSECKKYYEEELFPSMICTGGQESGKETCQVKSLSLNLKTSLDFNYLKVL